jgi:hypothetical protein
MELAFHPYFPARNFGREERFGEHRQRWENNMKVGHKCDVAGVKWLHITQDGVQRWDFMNGILNIQVPQKAEN